MLNKSRVRSKKLGKQNCLFYKYQSTSLPGILCLCPVVVMCPRQQDESYAWDQKAVFPKLILLWTLLSTPLVNSKDDTKPLVAPLSQGIGQTLNGRLIPLD